MIPKSVIVVFMFLFCIEYKNIFTESVCNNVVLKLLLSIFNLRGTLNKSENLQQKAHGTESRF